MWTNYIFFTTYEQLETQQGLVVDSYVWVIIMLMKYITWSQDKPLCWPLLAEWHKFHSQLHTATVARITIDYTHWTISGHTLLFTNNYCHAEVHNHYYTPLLLAWQKCTSSHIIIYCPAFFCKCIAIQGNILYTETFHSFCRYISKT